MDTITPFKGLELIVTIDDVENIRYLLDTEKKGFGFFCDVCEGESFQITALIEAVLDVSASKRYRQVILRDHEIKSISALKVIKCATCGCEDFVREKPRSDKNEDEGSISVGESTGEVRHG